MPSHEQWECFGPIATEDQIKYTKEEDMVSESMVFREETNYTFANGTNMEDDSNSVAGLMRRSNAAAGYISLQYRICFARVNWMKKPWNTYFTVYVKLQEKLRSEKGHQLKESVNGWEHRKQ